jgi:glutaredoxin-like YruB-family protein
MKVTIYSTPLCGWCKKTKEFFSKYKVKYQDINVAADQKAAYEMIEKSGQQGVPVIDIDGKIVIGFDEPKLRKLLKITG